MHLRTAGLSVGLALATLLVAATPAAGAASLDVPLLDDQDQTMVGGPVMFGHAAVWLTQQRDGDTLLREGSPDGRTRTIMTIPATEGASTEATLGETQDQVGVRAIATRPAEKGRALVSDRSSWARPGEAFRTFPACTLAVGDDYVLSGRESWDRELEGTCDTTWVLTGTGNAAGVRRPVPREPVVVGDLIGSIDYDGDESVHVQDWRTGRELYSIPTAGTNRFGLSMDEDGTVRYHDDVPERDALVSASVADPTPRVVAFPTELDPDADDDEIARATGWVGWAWSSSIGFAQAGGSSDGDRVLSFDVRCGVRHLMARDLAERPPTPASGACGVPVLLVRASATVRHQRIGPPSMRAHLRCPRSSNGCVGVIFWSTIDRFGGRSVRHEFARRELQLRPGETRSVAPRRTYRWKGVPRPVRVGVSQLEGTQRTHSLSKTIAIRRR